MSSVHNAAAPAATSPAAAILQAVLRVERAVSLAADHWLEDDIHWWPLYRLELYRLLFLTHASSSGTAPTRSRLGPALRQARGRTGPRTDRPVWLVSDGISYSRVGSHDVERFCEPLRSLCARTGVPTAVIDRGSVQARAYPAPTRWWAPWAQRAKIAATVATRLSPDARHDAIVADIMAGASRAGVVLPPLNPRRFDAMARAIKALARRVGAAMQQERPRAVFVVGYYDVGGYAYVLAAARQGIASVDLQHGVAGRFNLAYADWPPEARQWRLLPRWFWTWTEADAGLVRQWADPHADAPVRAVCGGHPFLQAWRDGDMDPGPAAQSDLRALLDAAQQRCRVLVTLQPHLVNPSDLAPLIEAWRLRPDTAWWLRLHPMGLHDRAALLAMLVQHGVRHADVDVATRLPLPLLLAHAQVHATHSSSTFIEAQASGLCSIVWSRYGAELAEDAVAQGDVSVALDGASFTKALDAAGRRDGTPGPPAPSALSALRSILESPT